MAAGNVRSGLESSDWTDFVHTGPGTLAGRYLRRFWQPVYLANELPVGKAVPVRLMSEDFTLYRGEGGRAYLLELRCAHRQNQLNTGWVEGDHIRCFYHGWKYDRSGQCVQQPGEPDPFCDRIHILGFPTHEHIGLIFAYLGEGEPPPVPRYPDFEGEDTVLSVSTYDRESNYYQSLENTPDNIHTYFVHYRRHGGGTEGFAAWRRNGEFGSLPRITAFETDWGMAVKLSRPDGDHIQGVIMPNIARRWSAAGRGGNMPASEEVNVGAWTDQFAWRVPIDDTSYRSFNVTASHGRSAHARPQRVHREWTGDPRPAGDLVRAILRSEAHIDGFVDHPQAGNIQDCVSQNGQGATTDRTREHLGRSDAGIVMLWQIWMRELRTLAEGTPLKQWSVPPSLRSIRAAAS